MYAEDVSPIDIDCTCQCCKPLDQGGLGITRAFIHHLAAKETAGAHLLVWPRMLHTRAELVNRLTLHNVHYLLSLMRAARTAIVEDRYPGFVRRFFADIYGSNPKEYPAWAVTALRMVNIDLELR